MRHGTWRKRACACTLMGTLLAPALALGQATSRAVFVSNNGNLEGSVTAFTVGAAGALTFVNRVVTGSRASGSDPCAGCNAYELSLSPNGRYLVTIHPAGVIDGISILEVAAAASVSIVVQYTIPAGQDGPLDVVWLDNEYFAVAAAEPNPDEIKLYRFDAGVPSISPVNSVSVGTNGLGYLALHPSRRFLYANDSSAKVVRAYEVSLPNLTPLDTESTGAPFPLELAVSPDGRFLYTACGISDGGNKIVALSVAGDGTLTPISGTPFTSPTTSTANAYVGDDNAYLIVGHSTSGQVHTFTIDQTTGAPTATGNFFDVGIQGEGQDVRTLGNFLFIVDNFNGPTGVYSFTLGAGGTLTPNGALVSTSGIAPRSLATWLPPPALGDLNCDLAIDLNDVDPFVLALLDPPAYAAAYPNCNINLADMNGDTVIDGLDAGPFVRALAP